MTYVEVDKLPFSFAVKETNERLNTYKKLQLVTPFKVSFMLGDKK